jgi:hypothetical protein
MTVIARRIDGVAGFKDRFRALRLRGLESDLRRLDHRL